MTADTPHDLGLTEVVLRPVRGHHAFEACVEQLGTLIRLGVYPLGTTLPSERELADRLHVSRATLREAMAALREAGLVETRRGRGGGTVVTMRPRTPSVRPHNLASRNTSSLRLAATGPTPYPLRAVADSTFLASRAAGGIEYSRTGHGHCRLASRDRSARRALRPASVPRTR